MNSLHTNTNLPNGRILLTGATGYVGGRLLSRLEEYGHDVRCLARRPEFLLPRVKEGTQVARGDIFDIQSLENAFAGIHTAYYLVHALSTTKHFEEAECLGAQNFAKAAKQIGVRRIIYLGGLAQGQKLSPHLASRIEVGRILRDSGVTTVEFRAGIIIGSGSLSFEMIRSLVDHLPVMVTPRWTRTLTQPIAIGNVIDYLQAALKTDVQESTVFEIGSSDRISYMDLMKEYARQRELERVMIPVPLLTPTLSSLWLGLVTPIYARVGRKLVEGVRNETVIRDDKALRVFPIRPLGYREAIQQALANEDHEFAQTRWSDAVSSHSATKTKAGVRLGSRMVDSRSCRVSCSPQQAFIPIQRIGGKTGWYYGNWLWRIRGFLDLAVGGIGMRRGRPHPDDLKPGDTVDSWRVEAYEPNRLLRLSAEMRLPGRAWLQFDIEEDKSGTVIRQTAIFDPSGLTGILYWYALFPLHKAVFTGMLRSIVQAAETQIWDEGKLE